jgi:hypothetical protein
VDVGSISGNQRGDRLRVVQDLLPGVTQSLVDIAAEDPDALMCESLLNVSAAKERTYEFGPVGGY